MDINTIYAGTLRRRVDVDWDRERLELEDGDFVDLDWLRAPESDRVVVLTHGLEGHARRPYIAGMARAYHRAGFAVCAMNFRGCSGEPNRHLRSYHIGETGDLRQTVAHALRQTGAEHLVLTGYSLGGNVIIKYLADNAEALPSEVRGAATFSVPLYVDACNKVINTARNWAYRWSFITHMNRKAKHKAEVHDVTEPFKPARNFDEFDEWYTAPWHGFDSAQAYWRDNSAGRVLHKLQHPVLVVNAADDSFLHPSCYPFDLAERLENFYLEVPEHGGHCGFVARAKSGNYYSDIRAVRWAHWLIAQHRASMH